VIAEPSRHVVPHPAALPSVTVRLHIKGTKHS
jgi:hypothetical protein